ncbi:MAG: helix-turn-helix domain-containing protein [Bacilli bacterium]
MDDRMTIQACIHDNRSMTQISSYLGVNKSTISREIRLHQITKQGYFVKSCPHRSNLGLCNGCPHRNSCTKDRHYYNYLEAQQQAESIHLSAYSKSKLSPQNIRLIDDIVTDGVRLGQSLHHIYVSNPILANICAERTIRRLCYRRELTVKPHELRRYVVYKHGYKKHHKKLNFAIFVSSLVACTRIIFSMLINILDHRLFNSTLFLVKKQILRLF